jgi:hypothetical protein
MKKQASILDWPKPTLNPEIWNEDNTLKPEVKSFILDFISSFAQTNNLKHLYQWVDLVQFVGSLTTNTYNSASDADIHLHTDLTKFVELERSELSEKEAHEYLDEIRKQIDRVKVKIPNTKHPIELFFETPLVTPRSFEWSGLYSILEDKWLEPPHLVDKDFDVEQLYPELLNTAKETATELDETFGDIKREISDIKDLEETIASWPQKQKDSFEKKLQKKLDALEKEIQDAVDMREDIVEQRKHYKALSQQEITMKYLSKYFYMNILTDLRTLLKQSPELTTKDIPVVENIMQQAALSKKEAKVVIPNGNVYDTPEKAFEANQIIMIDFDGTIAQEHKDNSLGEPLKGAKEVITDLKEQGYYIIIDSHRGNTEEGQDEIKEFMDKYEIPYDEIYQGDKPLAWRYIDDRAIQFTNWSSVLKQVEKDEKKTEHLSEKEASLNQKYWIDPRGKEYPIEVGHYDWIAENIFKMPRFTKGLEFTQLEDKADEMLKEGWTRITTESDYDFDIEVADINNLPPYLDNFIAKHYTGGGIEIDDLEGNYQDVEEPFPSLGKQINKAKRLRQQPVMAAQVLSKKDAAFNPYQEESLKQGPAYAVYVGTQETGLPDFPPVKLYNIFGDHPRFGSTVSEETLKELGIPIREDETYTKQKMLEDKTPLERKPKTAQLGSPYDYSSTQFNLPKELSEKIIRWAVENIPEEKIVQDEVNPETKGIQLESHISLKYGLLTNEFEEVKKALEGEKAPHIKFGKTSFFEPEGKDYDVVIISVESEDLQKLNEKLCSQVEHEDLQFKEYHPHVTVAYVKKGLGKNYDGKDIITDEELDFDVLIFSPKEGEKRELELVRAIKKEAKQTSLESIVQNYWNTCEREGWPGGMDCTVNSEELQKILQDKGFQVEQVSGFYIAPKEEKVWSSEPISHDWLVINGNVIIDVTHAQFGLPNFVITSIDDPRYKLEMDKESSFMPSNTDLAPSNDWTGEVGWPGNEAMDNVWPRDDGENYYSPKDDRPREKSVWWKLLNMFKKQQPLGKKEVAVKEAASSQLEKGWLAPDGQLFEIEYDDWHHKWIWRNKELLKTKYGISIKDLEGPTDGLVAKGWARLTNEYGPHAESFGIEVNNLNNIGNAVEDFVIQNNIVPLHISDSHKRYVLLRSISDGVQKSINKALQRQRLGKKDIVPVKEAEVGKEAYYSHAYWLDPNGKIYPVRGEDEDAARRSLDLSNEDTHSGWILKHLDMLQKEYGIDPKSISGSTSELVKLGWTRIGDAYGTDWGIDVADTDNIPSFIDDAVAQFAPKGAMITVAGTSSTRYGPGGYTFEWPVKSIQQTVQQIKRARTNVKKQPVHAKQASSNVFMLDTETGLQTKALKDPTPEQAENLFNSARGEIKMLRWAADVNGHLYMWDAYQLVHADAIRQIGADFGDDPNTGIIRSVEQARKLAERFQKSWQQRREESPNIVFTSKQAKQWVTPTEQVNQPGMDYQWADYIYQYVDENWQDFLIGWLDLDPKNYVKPIVLIEKIYQDEGTVSAWVHIEFVNLAGNTDAFIKLVITANIEGEVSIEPEGKEYYEHLTDWELEVLDYGKSDELEKTSGYGPTNYKGPSVEDDAMYQDSPYNMNVTWSPEEDEELDDQNGAGGYPNRWFGRHRGPFYTNNGKVVKMLEETTALSKKDIEKKALRGPIFIWLAPDGKEFPTPQHSHGAWVEENKPMLKKRYGLDRGPFDWNTGDDVKWLISQGWVRVTGYLPNELDLDVADIHNIPEVAERLVWREKPEVVIVEDLEGNDDSFDREEYSKGLMKAAALSGQTVNTILKLIEQNGGATYNVASNKNLVGTNAYAVAIYPDREQIVDLVDFNNLEGYLVENEDLLSNSNNSFGAWVSSEKTYLDVVATIKDKNEAIELGRKYKQLAIFDLKNLVEIPLQRVAKLAAANQSYWIDPSGEVYNVYGKTHDMWMGDESQLLKDKYGIDSTQEDWRNLIERGWVRVNASDDSVSLEVLDLKKIPVFVNRFIKEYVGETPKVFIEDRMNNSVTIPFFRGVVPKQAAAVSDKEQQAYYDQIFSDRWRDSSDKINGGNEYYDYSELNGNDYPGPKDLDKERALLDQIENPADRNMPTGLGEYAITYYDAMPAENDAGGI